MRVKHDQLDAELKRHLGPLYVVHGDEPLLIIEAADRIRRAARAAGFSEREVLHNERGFQWSALREAGQSMSLFGDRKLIELRIPTGKPGREGAAALEAHAALASPDVLTLISLPKLERDQRNSAWFLALEASGVTIEVPVIERERLGDWIGTRLAAQGQRASAQTLGFMAQRVEGNLLAAHQEIQKLALLYPSGELNFEQVQDAVFNVARYDVFKLTESLLAGDAERVVRTLEGLRAEGESPVLVHWVMSDELRTLARAMAAQKSGRPLATMFRELRIWGPRERLYEPALRRIRGATLAAALQRAAELDKMVKGLRIANSSGNVWNELTRLGLLIAG